MTREKNEEKESRGIPYCKATRVGNYKIWRGKYIVGSGKEKSSVDCVYVSNLDGSWQVRIPSTMLMYASITDGFSTTDEQIRNNFLGMIFTNMMNITTNASVALHDAMFFLTEMMSFPYLLLSEEEMKKRMKDGYKSSGMDKETWKDHLARMVDYRRKLYDLIEHKRDNLIEEYERQMAVKHEEDKAWNEEGYKQEEVADESLKILDEGASE